MLPTEQLWKPFDDTETTLNGAKMIPQNYKNAGEWAPPIQRKADTAEDCFNF